MPVAQKNSARLISPGFDGMRIDQPLQLLAAGKLAQMYCTADLYVVMSTAEGPFPMQTTYTREDADEGGTLMTLRNHGRPSGFGRVSSPLMARAMRRANRADLRVLKQLLESGAPD